MSNYALTYRFTIVPGGITSDEALANQEGDESFGATDALVVVSILKAPSGAASYAVFGVDGTTPDDPAMSPSEMFPAWVMLARYLSESLDEDDGRRDLCANVFEAVRQIILEDA